MRNVAPGTKADLVFRSESVGRFSKMYAFIPCEGSVVSVYFCREALGPHTVEVVASLTA
jgi:hypothetical protein